MKAVAFFAILVGLLMLVGCAEKEASVLAVSPGSGVGNVLLGASYEQVADVLGAPLLAESEVVGDSLMRNEWAIGDGILSVLLYDDEVVQIQVEDSAYETTTGISRQSSVSELREVYPDMEASVMAHDLENMYLDSVEDGIAFSIRGGRPGENTNADGDVINVFVHTPGREVMAIVHHHDGHH